MQLGICSAELPGEHRYEKFKTTTIILPEFRRNRNVKCDQGFNCQPANKQDFSMPPLIFSLPPSQNIYSFAFKSSVLLYYHTTK